MSHELKMCCFKINSTRLIAYRVIKVISVYAMPFIPCSS